MQSRRAQRALEHALFGPPPRAPRARRAREWPAIPYPHYRKGHCGMCGNICSPVEAWRCPSCGAVYPGGVTTRSEPKE